jgi:2'-5' RNA ligase
MHNESKYSLWLTPSGSDFRQLLALVNSIGHKYGTPLFKPHITLLSGLLGSEEELESRVSQLSSQFSAFTVHCSNMDWSDDYFRCLYIKVKKEPALVALHEQARKLIPNKKKGDFEPHISLMYGKLAHKAKQELAIKLEKEYPEHLLIDSLSLYQCSGPPESWHRVKESPLNPLRP